MTAKDDLRDLVLTRLIDAPAEKLYRAWTEPELLKQWFAPAPLTTPHAELDVRPGGANLIVMRTPDGAETPNRGVYLEVVANRRLVFTNGLRQSLGAVRQAFHDRHPHVRRRNRQDTLHGVGPPLDRGRPRDSRADGLPPRLGATRRPAGGPGRADLGTGPASSLGARLRGLIGPPPRARLAASHRTDFG